MSNIARSKGCLDENCGGNGSNLSPVWSLRTPSREKRSRSSIDRFGPKGGPVERSTKFSHYSIMDHLLRMALGFVMVQTFRRYHYGFEYHSSTKKEEREKEISWTLSSPMIDFQKQ